MKMADLPSRMYSSDRGYTPPLARKTDPNVALYAAARLMAVGDFIIVPKQRSNLSYALNRSTGFQFMQKVESPTTIRVWRTG